MNNYKNWESKKIIIEEYKKQIKSYNILFNETKNLNIIKKMNKIKEKIKIFEML